MHEYTQDTGRYSNAFNERSSSAMTGFIIGAAIGAGVALLLAPAPGVETRRRLGQTARRWGSNMKHGAEQANDRLGDVTHDVQGRLNTLKDDVRTAVAAGRDAFSREREGRSQRGSEGQPTP